MVIRRTSTVTLIVILALVFPLVGIFHGLNFRCQAPPPGPDMLSAGVGYSVIETTTHLYAIAGEYQEMGSNHCDVLILCPDKKIHGGLGNDSAQEIIECQDGGFALIGYTTSYGAGKADLWLLRTNSTGHHLWNKTFGTAEDEYGTALIRYQNNDYAIIGYGSGDNGNKQDVWVLRTDSMGNVLWNRTFGGSETDTGWSIILNAAGQLVITGTTESFGAGDKDIWLLCLDGFGNHLWNQTFGGKDADRGWDVTLAHDGGYAIIGSTTSSRGNDTDIWLIRTDAAGNQIMNTTIGDTRDDEGLSIITTVQGDFAMTGYADGRETIWFDRSAGYGAFFGGYQEHIFGTSIIEVSEGGFLIVGGINATSTENSRVVYWRLPSHYGPPEISLLWLIFSILYYGWPILIVILVILAIMIWRKRTQKNLK
ncbi:MAG: hypothetical protein ACFFCF_05650 [Promethearchaeota archaeon]